MTVLSIRYQNLIEQPARQAQRICDFLGRSLDEQEMSKAVDPLLYRNRSVEL